MFTIEKADSTKLKPKHRTIFNAAKERPLSQLQQDVLDGKYDNHPDFESFAALPLIRTLNQAMVKKSVKLDSVKEIVRGMYLHDYF